MQRSNLPYSFPFLNFAVVLLFLLHLHYFRANGIPSQNVFYYLSVNNAIMVQNNPISFFVYENVTAFSILTAVLLNKPTYSTFQKHLLKPTGKGQRLYIIVPTYLHKQIYGHFFTNWATCYPGHFVAKIYKVPIHCLFSIINKSNFSGFNFFSQILIHLFIIIFLTPLKSPQIRVGVKLHNIGYSLQSIDTLLSV